MRKLIIFTLGVIGLLAGAVLGAPTYYTDLPSFDAVTQINLVEDFESVSPKDTALASFVSNGVTYSGLQSSNPNVWVASAGYSNFGVPYPPGTLSSVLTATGPEDFDFSIELTLVNPSTAIGFDTYLNATGSAAIEVYGNTGLLGTFSLLHDYTQVGFFGVTANEAIQRIRWTTTGGQTVNTGIDNVRIGAVIPAPGALLLGSMGMGIVSWLRRRRTL